MKRNIKADIILPGDNSVGIPDTSFTIDFYECPKNCEFDDREWREDFRKSLSELFTQYFDPCGKAYIIFSDECSDCGHEIVDNHCTNKHCVQNMPE